VICAPLLVATLAALFFRPSFRNLFKPHTAMDPDSEVEFQMTSVLRAYKSGRVERFDGTETVPSSPAGDPANGVSSKDVVLDPAADISARIYLPPGLEPGKKRPVVVFFHGGAFMVHTAYSSPPRPQPSSSPSTTVSPPSTVSPPLTTMRSPP
jgi:acetyl esterase/lipase